jgi:hypothetical protein
MLGEARLAWPSPSDIAWLICSSSQAKTRSGFAPAAMTSSGCQLYDAGNLRMLNLVEQGKDFVERILRTIFEIIAKTDDQRRISERRDPHTP